MLDTNIASYYASRKAGYERIARRLSGRSFGEARISVITLAELEYGIAESKYKAQNAEALTDLLAIIQVDPLPIEAARCYAEIRAHLRRIAKPSGAYDMLIGAHALAIGATLVTNNEDDFRHMPGITVVNWLQK